MMQIRRRTDAPDVEPAGSSVVAIKNAPPRPAVAGRDLVKLFGEGDTAVAALRGVTVSFAEGSFGAIMGPSGSGKSTLMHILAGLDTPTSGSVEIAGVELAGLGDGELTELRRRRVGFVFQAFNLLAVLSAEENIELPLRLAGGRADREWLDELLGALDLGDRRKHRPAELSGGQQQRVAIARALVAKPSVVFADEPTGNLDSRTGDEVLRTLAQTVSELGQTVVMVTHDAHAASYSERVVFLGDGLVVDDQPTPSQEAILRKVGREH